MTGWLGDEEPCGARPAGGIMVHEPVLGMPAVDIEAEERVYTDDELWQRWYDKTREIPPEVRARFMEAEIARMFDMPVEMIGRRPPAEADPPTVGGLSSIDPGRGGSFVRPFWTNT